MTTGMFTPQRVCSRLTKRAISRPAARAGSGSESQAEDDVRRALHRAGDKQAIDRSGPCSRTRIPPRGSGCMADWSDRRCQRCGAFESQLPKQTDPLAKAYFEHALAMLGDADGAAALVANLSHPDKMIRTYAANFAGDARVVTAAPQLIKMLDDPWFDARIRAAQSLLGVGEGVIGYFSNRRHEGITISVGVPCGVIAPSSPPIRNTEMLFPACSRRGSHLPSAVITRFCGPLPRLGSISIKVSSPSSAMRYAARLS